MALWEFSYIDSEEVWAYLNPPTEDRIFYDDAMEGWINGASILLEGHLNRPILRRTFDVYQNGNGRRKLFTDYYPITSFTTLEVSTRDLLSTYPLSTDRADKQVTIRNRTGEINILPFAQIGHFFRGHENVHLVYSAGFSGVDLEPFKTAIKELIQVYWKDLATNPRVQQLNETVGNGYFTGRFDPSKLSHQTKMLIDVYRRTEV